jgi:hypothetical protein
MRSGTAILLRLVLMLAIATCSVRVASADPIVVTGGAFNMHNGDPSVFRFIGSGFNLIGGALIDAGSSGPLSCNPCSGGTAVDLSSHLSGNVGQWVNRPDFPLQFGGATYATVLLRRLAVQRTHHPCAGSLADAFLCV